MTLGMRLAEGRLAKRITQKDLADKLGVGQSTISEVEGGEYIPVEHGSWRYLLKWIRLVMPKDQHSKMLDLVVEEALNQYSARIKRLIYGKDR